MQVIEFSLRLISSFGHDTTISELNRMFQINGVSRVFQVYTEMALLASKDLTTAKKVTSSGARPDTRDYYWFKSPMTNQRLLDQIPLKVRHY